MAREPMSEKRSRDVVGRRKRDFRMHAGAWLIVNAMFVGIWLLTGAHGNWPAWIALFWGVGVAFHGWWAYLGQAADDDA